MKNTQELKSITAPSAENEAFERVIKFWVLNCYRNRLFYCLIQMAMMLPLGVILA